MYRYARPQRGRYREHWQLSVEAIGSDDPAIDAELIQLYDELLAPARRRPDYRLQLNSIGDGECRPGYVERLNAWLDEHADRPRRRGAREARDEPAARLRRQERGGPGALVGRAEDRRLALRRVPRALRRGPRAPRRLRRRRTSSCRRSSAGSTTTRARPSSSSTRRSAPRARSRRRALRLPDRGDRRATDPGNRLRRGDRAASALARRRDSRGRAASTSSSRASRRRRASACSRRCSSCDAAGSPPTPTTRGRSLKGQLTHARRLGADVVVIARADAAVVRRAGEVDVEVPYDDPRE